MRALGGRRVPGVEDRGGGRTERGEQVVGHPLGALEVGGAGDHHAAVEDQDLPTGEHRGHAGQRRQVHQAQRGRGLPRRVGGPRLPERRDDGGVGRVPERAARDDERHGQELDLDLGDDAEAAAPAAQRPEQLRLVLRARDDRLAVGQHDGDRADVVGGDAGRPAVEADAAAEQVADDADGGAGAVQRGEAVRLGRGDERAPGGAGGDAGGPADGVDPDGAVEGGADEDGGVEGRLAARAVAGALRADGRARRGGRRGRRRRRRTVVRAVTAAAGRRGAATL